VNAPADPGALEPTRTFRCDVVGAAGPEPATRRVIEEQPLRILVDGSPVATLMRTPGGEAELALGFLLTEGIVRSAAEVGAVSFCRDGSLGAAGEVDVRLVGGAAGRPVRRYRDIFSSCSLCGDEWIEEVAADLPPFERPAGRLRAADILRVAETMAGAQPGFAATGGAHAAALAELPFETAVVREDLGRHNALDKAVGAALTGGMDLGSSLLVLSSRLSFEMAAKAARAGICDVAGVSAPSAAAVRLARRLGMFLAGFVRGGTMTVYAGLEALAEGSAP
jgi:FdhD protein